MNAITSVPVAKRRRIHTVPSMALLSALVLFLLGCATTEPPVEASALGGTAAATASSELGAWEWRPDGVLRVGTPGGWFASFVDPVTGDRGGYDIELVEQLAADLGLSIVYFDVPFNDTVEALETGMIDLATPVAYVPGRAKTTLLSRPLQLIGLVLVMREEDSASYRDWETITRSDLVIGVSPDHYAAADGAAGASDVRFERYSKQDAIESLRNGSLHIYVTHIFDAAGITMDHPGLVVAHAPLVYQNYRAFAIRPRAETLKFAIDAWIENRMVTGYFEELAWRWHVVPGIVTNHTETR